jgi:hypothetical protein
MLHDDCNNISHCNCYSSHTKQVQGVLEIDLNFKILTRYLHNLALLKPFKLYTRHVKLRVPRGPHGSRLCCHEGRT